MKTLRNSIVFILFTSLGAGVLSSCGASGKNKAVPLGENQTAAQMRLVASENQLPAELLLAIAYHESRFQTGKQSVVYRGTASERVVSPAAAETSFGLSRGKLSLTGAEESQHLVGQSQNYASFIREQLVSSGFQLDIPFDTLENKTRWIWALSKYHREGFYNEKFFRTLFTREILQILKNGFYWRDGDQVIKVEPGNFDLENLPRDVASLLRYNDSPSSVSTSIRKIQINTNEVGPRQSNPTKIKVIHCPFSFSTCVQMQEMDSETPFQAHFVIGNTQEVYANALQTFELDLQAKSLDRNGNFNYLNNTVVIMLSGYSGFLENGTRKIVNPVWYRDEQLKTLRQTISNVCDYLGEQNPSLNVFACNHYYENGTGIVIEQPLHQENRMWGEVFDFDPKLFGLYLDKEKFFTNEIAPVDQNRLESTVYESNREIPIRLNVSLRTSLVKLQQAVMCSSGEVRWETLDSIFISNPQNQLDLKVKLFDAGPNGNGNHFLRFVAYNKAAELEGWNAAQVSIRNFDPDLKVFYATCEN